METGIAKKQGAIAIMPDLQGPKLQVGVINLHSVVLQNGDQVALTTQPTTGERNVVNFPDTELIQELEIGDPLLLADGALWFMLERKMSDILGPCRDEIKQAMERFNHRPRKTREFRRPYEALFFTLTRLTVALGS